MGAAVATFIVTVELSTHDNPAPPIVGIDRDKLCEALDAVVRIERRQLDFRTADVESAGDDLP